MKTTDMTAPLFNIDYTVAIMQTAMTVAVDQAFKKAEGRFYDEEQSLAAHTTLIAGFKRAALANELLDALLIVKNQFWNPETNPPVLRECDVQDIVEKLIAKAGAL